MLGMSLLGMGLVLAASPCLASPGGIPAKAGSNPIIRDIFTADTAPLVVGDRLYM